MRLISMLALALPILGATGDASATAPAASAAAAAASSAALAAPAAAPSAAPGAALLLAQAADTAVAEPPARMERSKPSGFWGSTRPAQGGAYRYRLLGIGVAVSLLALAIMLWVLRRPARSPGGAAGGSSGAEG